MKKSEASLWKMSSRLISSDVKRNVTPAMPLPSRANTNASVWSYGGKSIPALTILRVPSLSSSTSL